jgi:hypothetical protein
MSVAREKTLGSVRAKQSRWQSSARGSTLGGPGASPRTNVRKQDAKKKQDPKAQAVKNDRCFVAHEPWVLVPCRATVRTER